jgi:phospholipid N-methyltransferase
VSGSGTSQSYVRIWLAAAAGLRDKRRCGFETERGRPPATHEYTRCKGVLQLKNAAQTTSSNIGKNGEEHEGLRSDSYARKSSSGKPPAGFLFALSFFKHPNMVGWVLPSSRFLVKEVLKQIDWEAVRVIVEYGPGVGAFTTKLLERMRSDAKLIALEINSDFYEFLNVSLQDPRLHLVKESAREIDAVLARLEHSHADYVISGIPFKCIPHALRDTIVRKTHSVLRPNGTFLVYQFSSVVFACLESVQPCVARFRVVEHYPGAVVLLRALVKQNKGLNRRQLRERRYILSSRVLQGSI